MRAALSFVVLALAASSAVGQLTPLERVRAVWQGCVRGEIEKLDDGVSPAADIATAVQRSCEAEHDAMLDTMTLSPQVRYQISTERAATTREFAIGETLRVRATRRAPKS